MTAPGREPALAGVLDVGSNSVLLLVAGRRADGRLATLDAAVVTTRLGAGLRPGGSLDPDARRRTEEAVAALAARARARGAPRLFAFATGAARRAADGPQWAAELAERQGLPVEILSGAREARLAFTAAVGTAHDDGWVVVVDVGGLTTEVTLGRCGVPEQAESLAVGALDLAERHGAGPDFDVAAAQREVERAIRVAAVPAVAASTGPSLVASGGTATSLAALDLGLDAYDGSRVHGHRLAVEALASLAASPRSSALDPDRAAILPAGALVLEVVSKALGADGIVVSDHGVRHAYLRERLAANGLFGDGEGAWD